MPCADVPHDQQHHRITRIAETLGPEPQSPGFNESNIAFNHGLKITGLINRKSILNIAARPDAIVV
jgi:hypothetical protein